MILEIDESNDLGLAPARADQSAPALPPHLVWTQRAAAALRAHLFATDRTDYRLFIPRDLELHDLDEQLPHLDANATWQPAPAVMTTAEPVDLLTQKSDHHTPPRAHSAGFVYLAPFDVWLARWYWINGDAENTTRAMWLAAARSTDAIARLRDALAARRRQNSQAIWRIVRGYSYLDRRVSRTRVAPDDLLLPVSLHERLTADVLRFFSPEVAQLYATLKVPYRRGVLMYGPPGNGKTSIIRWIGGELMHIPAMTVRVHGNFDSDDFAEIIRRWRTSAPAILVIEDLNWVIDRINVSSFLNTLDGIDDESTNGCLLIATTNYPERLDAAINNRPGRFDVTIEIPSPDESLRRDFLRRKLPASISDRVIESAAQSLDRCSFAHLHEVLRLSGLYAIHAGRMERSDEDVTRAASEVASVNDAASKGFSAKLEVPFGLQHLKKLRDRNNAGVTQ
jgi:histone H3/H4